ncbi:hypothetical protein BLOT_011042 [Blomia tropicalis]|nr:hypothetical protein BLOT_011042 [Blomia tropicalis]
MVIDDVRRLYAISTIILLFDICNLILADTNVNNVNGTNDLNVDESIRKYDTTYGTAYTTSEHLVPIALVKPTHDWHYSEPMTKIVYSQEDHANSPFNDEPQIDLHDFVDKMQSSSRPPLENDEHGEESHRNRPSFAQRTPQLSKKYNKKNKFNKGKVVLPKSKKSKQEMIVMFEKLKSSLNKLLCYENDDCYGGTLGDDKEKLDQFVRHIHLSKKVFDMLESNRRQLALLEQEYMKTDNDNEDELDDGQPTENVIVDDHQQKPIIVPMLHNYDTKRRRSTLGEHVPLPNSSVKRKLFAGTGGGKNGAKNGAPAVCLVVGGGSIGGGSVIGTNLFTNRDPHVNGQKNGDETRRRPVTSQSSSSFIRNQALPPKSHTSSSSKLPPLQVGWPEPVLVIKKYEEYDDDDDD